MIVLTTTYNCENFVERSLLTIMTQRFKDFKCYITDDMSTDKTVDIIKKTILGDNRFILIENKQKMYQPGNYDQVIRGLDIPDDEICVEIDGDDWLPNSNVLSFINDVYKDENVWINFRDDRGRVALTIVPKDNRKQMCIVSYGTEISTDIKKYTSLQ